jgi:uncharacterized protein YggU (UPF0235/DUF167 family)
MSAQLRVHVHPGARRESLRGWRVDGALRLEVTAPPEAGLANRAVAGLLAGVLGLRRTQVAVVRGLASRAKLVEVEGLDDVEIHRRIDAALRREEAADGA